MLLLSQAMSFLRSFAHINIQDWEISLIIPKCAGIKRDRFKPEYKDHRMMRLYVGSEEAEYLIADLERGFHKI